MHCRQIQRVAVGPVSLCGRLFETARSLHSLCHYCACRQLSQDCPSRIGFEVFESQNCIACALYKYFLERHVRITMRQEVLSSRVSQCIHEEE